MIVRKYLTFALVAVYFLPSLCQAGQVNGTLRRDGQLQPGLAVTITCEYTDYPGMTDLRGAFSVYVNQTGACMLEALGATHMIYSYENPVRYYFDFNSQDRALKRE